MEYDKSALGDQENLEPKKLTHEEALMLFTKQELEPRVSTPWDIVKFQSLLTIAVTILSIVCSMFFLTKVVVVSVLLGGVLGIVPTSAFIIRVNLVKKIDSRFAKRFVSSLVYAEVIKITLTLTIIILTIRLYQNLSWPWFLGTYIITLQAYWLIGFIKYKKVINLG